MPAATSRLPELTDVAVTLDSLLSWLRRNAPMDGYSMTARTTLVRLLTEGPTRISDLAKAEGISQPAMTGLINRLELESLVRRDRDPSDARATLVVLTDGGQQFIAERRAVRSGILAAQLDILSAADQQALIAAAPALSRLVALPLSAKADPARALPIG
jgi:DNA-binding MarR family transcriptional regulator